MQTFFAQLEEVSSCRDRHLILDQFNRDQPQLNITRANRNKRKDCSARVQE